jgi:hypothetical protein
MADREGIMGLPTPIGGDFWLDSESERGFQVDLYIRVMYANRLEGLKPGGESD